MFRKIMISVAALVFAVQVQAKGSVTPATVHDDCVKSCEMKPPIKAEKKAKKAKKAKSAVKKPSAKPTKLEGHLYRVQPSPVVSKPVTVETVLAPEPEPLPVNQPGASDSGIHLSLNLGAIALKTVDKTFTGLSLGAGLQLKLTDAVSVDISGAGLFSATRREPVGAMARAGLIFNLDNHWAIVTGLNSIWASYNDQLKAKVAFITADVGVAAQYGPVRLSVAGLGGAAFDRCGKSIAYGATGGVGVVF